MLAKLNAFRDRDRQLPQTGPPRAVQVDLNGSRMGLRYPIEVGLVGDVKATLTALLPLLAERRNHAARSARIGVAQRVVVDVRVAVVAQSVGGIGITALLPM